MRLLTAGSSVRVRQGEPDGRAATNGGGQPFSNTLWAFSSVGQSGRLITGWSGVRVPEGPPRRQKKGASFRFRGFFKPAKTAHPLPPLSSQMKTPRCGLFICINETIQGNSSAGRAAVSKTVGRGFEAFFPCHKTDARFLRKPGVFCVFGAFHLVFL